MANDLMLSRSASVIEAIFFSFFLKEQLCLGAFPMVAPVALVPVVLVPMPAVSCWIVGCSTVPRTS